MYNDTAGMENGMVIPQKIKLRPSVVVYTIIPSTQEAKAGRPAWGLHK
jgi:hypothetical protein